MVSALKIGMGQARAVQSHLVTAIEQRLLVGGVETFGRRQEQVFGCPGEVETESVGLRDYSGDTARFGLLRAFPLAISARAR